MTFVTTITAGIAQLGERQTEDLKVRGSIPGLGISFFLCLESLPFPIPESLRLLNWGLFFPLDFYPLLLICQDLDMLLFACFINPIFQQKQ